MVKLSKAQRRVLERMATGEVLHHGATGGRWWLSAPPRSAARPTRSASACLS